jgi:hypothetical protein
VGIHSVEQCLRRRADAFFHQSNGCWGMMLVARASNGSGFFDIDL